MNRTKLVLLGGAILIVSFAILRPGFAQAKRKRSIISCINNMQQIGLARQWLENCQPDENGFDTNAFLHLSAMSNEIGTTKVLVCPSDPTKQSAIDFAHLGPENLSYQIRCRTNLGEFFPDEILMRCPIHSLAVFGDGSIRFERKQQAQFPH